MSNTNNTRLTQEQQIKSATKAYLVYLNEPRDGMSKLRFAVYLLRDGALTVLWPSDSHNRAKTTELLCGQVYCQNHKYPAYHFALGGCGYSKSGEIADTLRQINPEITVDVLGGHMPSQA